MSYKEIKNIGFVCLMILAFILGRESKSIDDVSKPAYYADTLGKINSVENRNQLSVTPPNNLGDKTIVYRCGKSNVYHPTTSHASFKRCKSKIYELTVEEAKAMGLRHCKCKY